MANLKTIKLPVSANIKLALVALACIIVAGTLIYTQRLAQELKASERKTVQLFASLFSRTASAPQVQEDDGGMSSVDVMSDLALELGNTIDFPIIVANADKEIEGQRDPQTDKIISFNLPMKNIYYDSTASMEQQYRELKDRLESMASTYDPLPIYAITDTDTLVSNWIFYDDSDTVKQIQMLPYIGLIISAMFLLVAYISFSHIKRNEQSNIWVGMAKETAHQLGTPLSSLLGWIELLRYTPEDTAQVLEAADEMERDVERLNKIALRFSKIGSAAELRPVELNDVLGNVVVYFKRRLPHLGKKITLALDRIEPVYVAVNIDLLEWVFENLVRNAADAIDHIDGTIRLQLHQTRGAAIIDVIDNGRGIDPKIKKDIFRPGFSTKQRGWGLGLSLAKRIVEEYHGGKIFVKQTSPAGTTFRIRLPLAALDTKGQSPTRANVGKPASEQPAHG